MVKKILASLMVGGALLFASPMVADIPDMSASVAHAQDYWVATDGDYEYYVSDIGLKVIDLPKGGCRIEVNTKRVDKGDPIAREYVYIFDNIHHVAGEGQDWMWIYKGSKPTKLSHWHRAMINKCFELKGINVRL